MTLTKALFSTGCLTALLLAASPARAQECKTAADCGKGFTCTLVTVEPVTATKVAPCPAGAVCPVVDPVPPDADAGTLPAPVDAGTTTSGYCSPAPCTTAADCGAGMVCHTETYQECTGGGAPACPPNMQCDPLPSTLPSCTPKSVSACAYKWQLPCNVDTDCGDGFTCAPSVTGACSGSGGSADAGTATVGAGTTGLGSASTGSASTGSAPASTGSSAAPSTPVPSCMTTTSFPGSCTPKATSCKANTDCPAQWTCVDEPSVGAVTGTASTDGGTSTRPAMGAPTPAGMATPPATAPVKVCASPLGTFGGAPKDGSGVPQTGGNGSGTGGATGANGGGTSPTAAGTSAASSGCAIGGAEGGSPLAAFALALLGLVVIRRRR
jgi:MYXO-CTERM domain-containing protein